MNVKNKMRSLVYITKHSNNANKVLYVYNKNTFRAHHFCKQKDEKLKINFRSIMENNVKKFQLWDVAEIFNSSPDNSYAVIVLNRPIECESNFVRNLWKKAQVRITVDAGTDRWLTFLGDDKDKVLNGLHKEYLPDIVTGDMDSVREDTLKILESLGVKIICTIDQDETDYTKSLRKLNVYCKEKNLKIKCVYVFNEVSGRMDQIIAGINTLHKSQKILPNIPVIQIAKGSLTWLLQPGEHKIMIPNILRNSKTWCSLLPVGFPAKSVSTTGLKWNLDNNCLEVGGLVSSSNTYSDEPCVTINIDTPIIWSMGIKPLLNNNKR
ncbi:thiamin pyrophosphokinase 1 isoform X2 [Leptopilina boulardi]|nr:thiamin pyrophosphokinase 1 isoform X2 [Leptopilina boulardi]